ncbi:RagB/SusD family nutrient uptake outer membrane protein [uncultured Algoriphagus sp.]|uniref:RagB/SusD family nutrient uptake outer membrane protein n=1 Tax=uncultured Algoriphagus sp. TaxID=417365 RepID=UPI0030EC5558|tara:strand:- start:4382 stop:5743 length:1362 start_codon:yes stop_codon:yes gene_type:complete
MKKYIIIGLVLLFSGCADQLDLAPQQSVDQDLALSTDANVKRVLQGAYSEIRSTSLYGGSLLLYAEMLGANREVRWEGTFNQPREMFNKNILVNNSFVQGSWSDAYKAINVANNVLASLEVVDSEDQERVEGEALFIRGSMFFELVKFFALPYSAGSVDSNLGVPLVLTPTRQIDEDSYVARNTVAEVYAQIISDLEKAEVQLPAVNGFLARNYVVAAQLSRVFLQMGDYEKARDAADRAISISSANGKILTLNYLDAFNTDGDSPEDLFSIQVNTQDGGNDMFLYYSLPEYGARGGDVSIQASHFDYYEAGDARLDQFFEGAGEQRTAKWRDQYKNVKVIRLAEMYLTRAEANFRLGTSVGAAPLADLNRIRQRVDLPALGSISLEVILAERKVELAHEGQYLHDVKRTGGLILDNSSSETYNFDDGRLIFPIPQREMDANPSLVQNSAYTN